jgi:signal transduction histidine kinase
VNWWIVGAVSNAVILGAYLAIAGAIAIGLARSGQWRQNPLGVATAAIFLTSAIHHGSLALHTLLPYAGLAEHSGTALRTAFNGWEVALWDVITALVGLWYWSLRSRFPALVRGAALFEDIKQRQRQALEIHDNIVQGLATAKLSFELDREQEGREAVERTLLASRRIITDLLGEEGSEIALSPGDFRRGEPAGTH